MAFQGDSIYWVEVEKIVPNPFQPRREFDEAKLNELSESIRMYGVLQPLTVTRKEVQRDDSTFYTKYELIAGERRLRASKLAGVSQVPVLIRDGEETEQEKLELAIIENLQREDLNAVDRALAFKQLADQFELSHAEVAKKVGRSREYVSNSIRLLALPEHMLGSLKRGEMMEGHARTLLMLTDKPEEQEVVFKEILLKKLSVREVERIVRKIATDKVRKKNPGEFDGELIEMEKQFTETLGTRVQIQKTDFGGKLTIDYFSVEDLESLLARVRAEAVEAGVSTPDAMAAATLSAHTPLAIIEQPTETAATPDVAASGNEFAAESPTPQADTVTPPATPKQSVPATETETSAVKDVPETAQTNSEIQPTPETPPVSSPANPDPQPVRPTAEQPKKPSSSLSDALARAIGFSNTPKTNAVAELDHSTQHADTRHAQTNETKIELTETEPAVHPVPPKSVASNTEEDDDDSSLYSINRFTV